MISSPPFVAGIWRIAIPLSRRSCLLAIALACVLSGADSGVVRAQVSSPRPREVQQAGADEASRSNALRVARDIMRVARYCALITQDPSSGSSARTIDPAPPDSAMVVRFVTNPRSRKVRQLARDPRVTLYYFDAPGLRYVTVYGRARAVVDSAEKRRQWYDAWTPFYPGRERDATLYVVTPERLEVVSPNEGLVGDSVTWATPTVRLGKPRPLR